MWFSLLAPPSGIPYTLTNMTLMTIFDGGLYLDTLRESCPIFCHSFFSIALRQVEACNFPDAQFLVGGVQVHV